METSKTYNRTINLLDKYTKFIKSIDTEDIGNNLTLDKLIELKSILSDINNIMTLISTRSIATKLKMKIENGYLMILINKSQTQMDST